LREVAVNDRWAGDAEKINGHSKAIDEKKKEISDLKNQRGDLEDELHPFFIVPRW
jgi:hypothetical protein